MQAFGRSLMRHYIGPETGRVASNLPPPPSWQSDAQTPLIWNDPAAAPVEYQIPDIAPEEPTVESLPFEPAQPPRPARPAAKPVQPAQSAQHAPVQRKPADDEESKIDPRLLAILAAHQEHDNYAAKVREERKAAAAADDVQRKAEESQSDAQLTRRRNRASFDYVETKVLRPQEGDADYVPPPKNLPPADVIQPARSPEQPDDDDTEESSPAAIIAPELETQQPAFDDETGDTLLLSPVDLSGDTAPAVQRAAEPEIPFETPLAEDQPEAFWDNPSEAPAESAFELDDSTPSGAFPPASVQPAVQRSSEPDVFPPESPAPSRRKTRPAMPSLQRRAEASPNIEPGATSSPSGHQPPSESFSAPPSSDEPEALESRFSAMPPAEPPTVQRQTDEPAAAPDFPQNPPENWEQPDLSASDFQTDESSNQGSSSLSEADETAYTQAASSVPADTAEPFTPTVSQPPTARPSVQRQFIPPTEDNTSAFENAAPNQVASFAFDEPTDISSESPSEPDRGNFQPPTAPERPAIQRASAAFDEDFDTDYSAPQPSDTDDSSDFVSDAEPVAPSFTPDQPIEPTAPEHPAVQGQIEPSPDPSASRAGDTWDADTAYPTDNASYNEDPFEQAPSALQRQIEPSPDPSASRAEDTWDSDTAYSPADESYSYSEDSFEQPPSDQPTEAEAPAALQRQIEPSTDPSVNEDGQAWDADAAYSPADESYSYSEDSFEQPSSADQPMEAEAPAALQRRTELSTDQSMSEAGQAWNTDAAYPADNGSYSEDSLEQAPSAAAYSAEPADAAPEADQSLGQAFTNDAAPSNANEQSVLQRDFEPPVEAQPLENQPPEAAFDESTYEDFQPDALTDFPETGETFTTTDGDAQPPVSPRQIARKPISPTDAAAPDSLPENDFQDAPPIFPAESAPEYDFDVMDTPEADLPVEPSPARPAEIARQTDFEPYAPYDEAPATTEADFPVESVPDYETESTPEYDFDIMDTPEADLPVEPSLARPAEIARQTDFEPYAPYDEAPLETDQTGITADLPYEESAAFEPAAESSASEVNPAFSDVSSFEANEPLSAAPPIQRSPLEIAPQPSDEPTTFSAQPLPFDEPDLPFSESDQPAEAFAEDHPAAQPSARPVSVARQTMPSEAAPYDEPAAEAPYEDMSAPEQPMDVFQALVANGMISPPADQPTTRINRKAAPQEATPYDEPAAEAPYEDMSAPEQPMDVFQALIANGMIPPPADQPPTRIDRKIAPSGSPPSIVRKPESSAPDRLPVQYTAPTNRVMRAETNGEVPESPESSSENGGAKTTDIEKLAQDVYKTLRNRLRIEKERRGRG